MPHDLAIPFLSIHTDKIVIKIDEVSKCKKILSEISDEKFEKIRVNIK